VRQHRAERFISARRIVDWGPPRVFCGTQRSYGSRPFRSALEGKTDMTMREVHRR
jgi:hypothetical protein